MIINILKNLLFVIMLTTELVYNCLASEIPRHLPLAAYLDMADTVVVGKVIDIADASSDRLHQTRISEAAISVSEVLKGFASKIVKIKCISWVDPGYRFQSSIQPVKNGASGIWAIDHDGFLEPVSLRSYISEDCKADVVNKLKLLSECKWSKPVNGLRAKAAVIPPGKFGHPIIIFTVQNISKNKLFVPDESTVGFVTANARIDNKDFSYKLIPKDTGIACMLCSRLSPNEIIYLQPGYSTIDLRWNQSMPIGEYTVNITCRNTRTTALYTPTTSTAKSVDVWTGKLTASAKLILGPDTPLGDSEFDELFKERLDAWFKARNAWIESNSQYSYLGGAKEEEEDLMALGSRAIPCMITLFEEQLKQRTWDNRYQADMFGLFISLTRKGFDRSELPLDRALDREFEQQLFVDWWNKGRAQTPVKFASLFSQWDSLDIANNKEEAEKVASKILIMGIEVLPMLMKKIEDGDRRLLPWVYRIMVTRVEWKTPDLATVMDWWDKNKENLVFPSMK